MLQNTEEDLNNSLFILLDIYYRLLYLAPRFLYAR